MQFLLAWLTRVVGWMAKKTLARERPLIIAVTGSVGKSSTKQFLAALLRARTSPHVRVTEKSYNNDLGVPLTVFGRPAPGNAPFAWLGLLWTAVLHAMGLRTTGVQTFVFEMGADRPGDLARLTDLAPPSLSVVTAVTPEDVDWAPVHAANYPSIDAIAQEKSTLVRRLPPGGTMVLNADDPRVLAMRDLNPAHVLTFGASARADVQVLRTQVRMEGSETGALPVGLEIRLAILQQAYTIFLPGIFGRSMAFALAAAAAVGLALDLTAEEIIAACTEGYRPLPGRARLILGIKGTMLLDDTYNASPVSVLSALRGLSSLATDPSRQRKIACLGEMRELGPTTADLHARIGHEAARLGIDLLCVTGAYADAYRAGALAAGFPEDRVRVFADTPELGLWVQEVLRPGDIVLAKASQGGLQTSGVRLERVVKELMAEPARASELLCRQEAAWGTRC